MCEVKMKKAKVKPLQVLVRGFDEDLLLKLQKHYKDLHLIDVSRAEIMRIALRELAKSRLD